MSARRVPGRCAHCTYYRINSVMCHCYGCGRDFARSADDSRRHRVRLARVTLALFRRMSRRQARRTA